MLVHKPGHMCFGTDYELGAGIVWSRRLYE